MLLSLSYCIINAVAPVGFVQHYVNAVAYTGFSQRYVLVRLMALYINQFWVFFSNRRLR